MSRPGGSPCLGSRRLRRSWGCRSCRGCVFSTSTRTAKAGLVAKIAMFLARSPGPPMTGRKAVINTAIAALSEEDHVVDLFILAKRHPAPVWGREAFWLGTVPKVRMLCNAAWSILAGPQSLNEALFRSRSLLAMARGLGPSYDFAIADT